MSGMGGPPGQNPQGRPFTGNTGPPEGWSNYGQQQPTQQAPQFYQSMPPGQQAQQMQQMGGSYPNASMPPGQYQQMNPMSQSSSSSIAPANIMPQQQMMGHQPRQGYNSPAAGLGGSVSSTAPASQQPVLSQQVPSVAPVTQAQRDAEAYSRRMEPPAYPEQILNNLSSYNVSQLCTIGKEIINDLNIRTNHFCQIMKSISEKRPANPQFSNAHINALMEYCESLLTKLYEIRLRIEKKAPGIKMDPDEFLLRMSDPTMPELPEKLQSEISEFERNRRQLVAISAEIKMFDWTAAVTDPIFLKNRDRLSEKS